MNLQKELEELRATLAQERDQLRVNAHLLKNELRDEWDETEKKWGHFQDKARHVTKAGLESSAEVGNAAKNLGKEIIQAYKHLRDSL